MSRRRFSPVPFRVLLLRALLQGVVPRLTVLATCILVVACVYQFSGWVIPHARLPALAAAGLLCLLLAVLVGLVPEPGVVPEPGTGSGPAACRLDIQRAQDAQTNPDTQTGQDAQVYPDVQMAGEPGEQAEGDCSEPGKQAGADYSGLAEGSPNGQADAVRVQHGSGRRCLRWCMQQHRPARLLHGVGILLLVAVGLAHVIHQSLQARLDPALEEVPLQVRGTVAALPARQGFGDRILFAVDHCEPVPVQAASGEADSSPTCSMLRQISLAWSAPRDGGLYEKALPVRAAPSRNEETSVTRAPLPGGEGTLQVHAPSSRRKAFAPSSNSEADDDRDANDPRDDVWPEPGQHWQLVVKLKRPVAAVNPGAFDTEQRMLQESIDATGRVVQRRRLTGIPVSDAMIRIESARASLREHLEALQAQTDPQQGRDARRWALLGIVSGLSLGDQAGMGADAWGLFSRTGVSHLMAISGMHVTLLALVVSALCLRLHALLARHPSGRLMVLLLAVPRPWVVLLPGVLSAFGYALLSGWGVPSQRTCFMLLAAAVLRVGGRCQSAVTPVLLAAAAIIVLDPWSVAQAGFWLSFCAVLGLIWCAQAPVAEVRLVQNERMKGWLQGLREGARNQWAATVLLTPLTIAFFSTWSLIGPVANVVAIPWVGMVLTPLAIGVMLLAPLWPWLAGWGLKLLLLQLGWLMDFLEMLDRVPMASISLPQPGAAVLLCALLGAILILAPQGLRRFRLGVLCLLPLALAQPRQAPDDALVITALDIGQGSMIVLEQGEHRMLFDTGPSRMGGRSALEGTLLPWLHGRGLDSIDGMVISHLDARHAGGTRAAMAQLRPRWWMMPMAPGLMGLPEGEREQKTASGRALHEDAQPLRDEAFPAAHDAESEPAGEPLVRDAPMLRNYVPCLAGQTYTWGNAVIEILSPATLAANPKAARDDRHSCVIRVRSPAGSVLLAGDLPVGSEAALVKAQGAALAADVLVLPQEGSRKGAGERLLDAVKPSFAVVQTSYRNHQNQPHAEVLQRLAARNIPLLRTDWHGAVRIELRQGRAPHVVRSRLDGAPYWRVQAGRRDGVTKQEGRD